MYVKVIMGSSGRHDASKSIADLAKAVRVSAGDATDETRLVDGFTPGPFDVICARGKTPRSHAGNIRMQELITELMDEYSSAKTKLDKSMIVTNVVDSVNDKSPSGGFVRKEMGKWTRLSAAAAREKVSQCFRDSLWIKYKSSSKSKQDRRAEVQSQVESEFEHLLKSNGEVADSVEQMHAGAQSDEVESVFDRSNAAILKQIKRHSASSLDSAAKNDDSSSQS